MDVEDGYGSDISYEYSSSEELSEVDEYEKEYFGEMSEDSTKEEEAVWEDDEDGEERLRKEYRSGATWLDGKVKKQLEVSRKKLKFDYKKFVFSSKCNIKLAKSHGNYLVLVDTYNIIYVLRDLKPYRVFQIEKFGVSDFVFVNGMILFASLKQSNFKEIGFDGKVKNIYRRTAEGIRKMIFMNGFLYLLGNQLTVMNGDYEVLEVFESRIKDFAVSDEFVYALDFSGQIFMLTLKLQALKRVALDDKFDFRSICFVKDMIIVGLGMGVKLFDKSMRLVKEFMNMKDEMTGCAECGEYIIYGSTYRNSLKIITPEMRTFDKFPFDSICIPSIKAISYDGRNIVICSGKAVNMLRIKLG